MAPARRFATIFRNRPNTPAAVVALAADPNVLEKSGRLLYVADLAEQYGFTDTDGKQVANFYRVLGIVR